MEMGARRERREETTGLNQAPDPMTRIAAPPDLENRPGLPMARGVQLNRGSSVLLRDNKQGQVEQGPAAVHRADRVKPSNVRLFNDLQVPLPGLLASPWAKGGRRKRRRANQGRDQTGTPNRKINGTIPGLRENPNIKNGAKNLLRSRLK